MQTARNLLLFALLCLAAVAASAQEWRGPASIAVEVKGKPRGSVGDALVILRFQEVEPSAGPRPVLTDSRGRAVVADLAQGVWEVEVSHDDFLSFVALVRIERGRKPTVQASFLQASGSSLTPIKVKFTDGAGKAPSAFVPMPPDAAARLAQRRPIAPPVRQKPEPAAETPRRPARPPEPVMPEPELRPLPEAAQPAETPAPPAATVPEPEPKAPTPVPAPEPEPSEVISAPEPPTSAPAKEPAAATPAGPPATEPSEAPQTVSQAEPAAPESPAAPAPTLPAPTPASPAPAAEPEAAPPPAAPQARPEPEPEPAPPAPVEPPTEIEPPADAEPPAEIEPPAAEPEAPPPAVAEETAPAPPAPSTEVPVESAPQPEPQPVAPSTEILPPPGPLGPTLRAYRDRSCVECRPGEWAISVEVVTGPATAPCDETLEDAGRELATRLGGSVALELKELAAPADVALEAMDDDDAAARVAELLGGPTDACRIVAAVIPKAGRFRGLRIEAADASGVGDCQADRPCPVGRARWIGQPRLAREPSANVIWGPFVNESPDRARRARLTVYFAAPYRAWEPPR